MSAPPSDKTQTGTHGIYIPGNSSAENMAHHQPHTETKPTERIIPIQIEGRDTPIIPKNASSTQSRPHQSFCGPDRIFGQRPEQFTQFIHRDPRQLPESWQDFVEEPTRKQNYQQHSEPHHSTQQHNPQARSSVKDEYQKEIPIPVQRNNISTESTSFSNQLQPDDQPKPISQEHKSLTPIEQIQVIQKDVSNLMEQVQQFTGKPRDKQYLYLDEMLTRNLIKLDNIEVQGQEIIRSSRKEAIKCIEKAIGILEAKAALNNAEKMDVDQSQKILDNNEKAGEKRHVKSDSATEGNICEKMDVSEASDIFKTELDQRKKESNTNTKELNEEIEEPQAIKEKLKDSIETSISGETTDKGEVIEGSKSQGNIGEAENHEVNDEKKRRTERRICREK